MERYKVVFEHDQDADFSWLEQDMYDPNHPSYEPCYKSKEDMEAGKEPFDGEWYRNPDNHVALQMVVYRMDDQSDDWVVIDSLGSIDFLADSDDWMTGTFYKVEQIPAGCEYMRELFQNAIDEHKAA